MRKLPLTAVLLTACAVCLVATEVAAGVSYLNEYVNHFTNSVSPVNNGKINIPYRYYSPMRKEEIYIKSAALSGEPGVVDSVLEFAIASYYSPEVVNIRPPEANEILPANNPRTAGLKLGSAVLKELAELKFLDPSNTAAIGRYEGMIKFISDKNGVSRAEMQDYLKQGIAALVREKFNEVSFYLQKYSGGFNATLSRDPKTENHTLTYWGHYTGNVVKTISGNGLDGLLAAMKNSPDFDEMGIDQIKGEAGHIPAVVYSSWVDKKMTTVDAVKLAADTTADFYLNPSRDNYDLLAGVYALILTQFRLSGGKDALADMAKESYYNALRTLNETLASRATAYGDGNIGLLARKAKEKDIRYGVFSVPGAMGGGR